MSIIEGQTIKRRISKEEIEALIDFYESSGLTIRQWCEEGGVPISTLSSWLRRRKKQREEEGVRFISLSPGTASYEEVVVEASLDNRAEAEMPGIIIKLSNCWIYDQGVRPFRG